MPRASGSGKRQQGAAGHRDSSSKHDNGLVGPAKRHGVAGKKGQGPGYPDGSAAARAADHVASHAALPSMPSSGSQQHHSHNQQQQHQHISNGAIFPSHHKNQPDVDAATLDRRTSDALPRQCVADYSETSSESCGSNMGGGNIVEGGHRQIDVNALKMSDVHKDPGPLEMAATVLRSLPIQDTLAILIILLHVPSLSLTVIYAAFTLLTFVPPVTTSSGMNINFAEIFDGSSTMPSLVTVGCVDCVFLLVWLFLWQPIQALILDFAKPVIAITLGGGTSARDGTSRGITTCFTFVLFQHLLRGSKSHWSRLLLQLPETWRLPGFLGNSLDFASTVSVQRNPHGLVRSVLAIHILTQGLVRYIREWYLKREKVHAGSGMSDMEAGKPQAGTTDGGHELGSNTPDTETGLLPATHTATAKKRRKQSTQIRLQQPLWAALASTKIVVMKEYELSHATSETAGTNATDIHNLGNAPFDTLTKQIWISYIGSDELCFSTSPFPNSHHHLDEQPKTNGHASRPAGIDNSKPFYVRVNDALWQPTRLFPVEDAEDESGDWSRWTGDIYGLRPMSQYVCEFVDSHTDKVIFTTSIRTIQQTFREKDGALPAIADVQQSLRPDSPATTLKTSIVAAESRLAEEKNRLKLLRKDCKTKTNALKKEIELTDNQLLSAGNHDEKYKQKIRQQETQKAQAERDTEALAEQLKAHDAAPEVSERKKRLDRAYSAEKKHFDAVQKEFKEYKSTLDAETKAKEVESSNLNTRRNKVATRIARVETELDNITDANHRGLGEAERRRQELATWMVQCSNIASNYDDRIAHVSDANASRLEYIRNAQTQLSSFHESMNSANGIPYDLSAIPPQHQSSNPLQRPQLPQQGSSSWNPNPAAAPHFPTSLWKGSSGDLTNKMPPATGAPNALTWPAAPAFEPRASNYRGRSSSMLSDVSGFTQSSEEDASTSPTASQQAGHEQGWGSRGNGNGSSGSTGSGSGSGSLLDPASPTV